MNIFQMKTKPHDIERFRQFIDGGFVCIGWPGIGDLGQADKDEIRSRLKNRYGYGGHKLGNALGQVNAFVNTMGAGDIVIISERDWAYTGKVGDYTYDGQFDNDQDGMCHRRSVEWLGRVLIKDLQGSIQKFIGNRNTICQFPQPIDETLLAELLGGKLPVGKKNSNKLNSLFSDALAVLESELKSPDPERRLKAATELIRLKNNR